MRLFNFFLMLACIVSLCACNQSKNPHAGFKTTESGLTYKFQIDEPGETPLPGDRIVYHMSFRKGDSTVTSSYEQGYPIDVRLPKGSDMQFDGNYLLQALSLMSKGDSLTYVRLIDSIPANARPLEFESGDWIYFDIAMKNTQTEKDFEAEKEAYLATFRQTPSGLYHQFIVDNEGPAPKAEEGVRYHLRLKKSNQTVYSTVEQQRPNGFKLPPKAELQAAIDQNPILEALTMMSLNDSMRVVFLSDSLQGALRPEWGFQSGDLVDMELKLIEVKSKKEMEAEQKAAEAQRSAQEKQMAEANKANIAKADKIDKQVQKVIGQYKAGKLTTKATDSGLKYTIVEKGSGQPLKAGDRVSVHYSGHLMDGTRFDASYLKGVPFPVTIGAGGVIAGWDEGLALMNAGDKAYLFIPPDLGYGEIGSPPRIPGNSDLVFYVELGNTDR